ncbi:MAG: hypothetical protein ACOYYU_15015 [Chloroflexota bacterium]
MKSQINDLVAMRDIESLLEVMEDHDDWIVQMDAAEGLVKLGDRRGLEYLLVALEGEDYDMREVAKEVLADPAVARMREEIEAEERRALVTSVEQAKVRLQKGRKVFTYKMVYLPAGEILSEDTSDDGFNILGLDRAGLAGWEVVNVIPRRRQVLVNDIDDHFVGAYFLLKKELAPEESAELDGLL